MTRGRGRGRRQGAGNRATGVAMRLAEVIKMAPLAPMEHHERLLGVTSGHLYNGSRELKSARVADHAVLGCTKPRTEHLYLTPEGQADLGANDSTWNQPAYLSRLLTWWPATEAIYPAMGALEGQLGPLTTTQWLEGVGFDAVASYQDGWALFYFAGVLRPESDMQTHITGLGDALVAYSTTRETARPSYLCFVAIDRWQAELVLRVARRLGMEDWIRVYCLADNRWRGAQTPLPHSGTIHQPAYRRAGNMDSFRRNLARSPWGREGSQDFFRVLLLILQWPGITMPMIRRLLKERKNGRRGQRALTWFLREVLIERDETCRPMRNKVTREGAKLACGWDRTPLDGAWEYMQMNRREDQGFQEHECELLEIMYGFMQAELATAAGWRCVEVMGSSGEIASDGLVYLETSPYGTGWHFVEKENRATSLNQIRAKLRGYLSSARSNSWPLLLVCPSEPAERRYHQVGQEGGSVAMLTTIPERIKRNGVLHPGCWSQYGRPALIG